MKRTGLGKVRHIHVSELWIQDALKTNRFQLKAIDGSSNPSDVLTKHVDRHTLEKHCPTIGIVQRQGRSMSAPKCLSGYGANSPLQADAEEE